MQIWSDGVELVSANKSKHVTQVMMLSIDTVNQVFHFTLFIIYWFYFVVVY